MFDFQIESSAVCGVFALLALLAGASACAAPGRPHTHDRAAEVEGCPVMGGAAAEASYRPTAAGALSNGAFP